MSDSSIHEPIGALSDAVNAKPGRAATIATWLLSQKAPLLVCPALAAVPRVWLALTDHSVFWPDEIYQSLEPAHRIAFGYGLVSWEFRDGARSWLLPGVISGVLKGMSFFTSSSLVLVCAVKLLMVACALAGIVAAVTYAEKLGGRTAAWLTGLFACAYPPLLVFSHRATPEMASAPLLVLTALYLLRSDSRPYLAGGSVGLAVCLRMQTAPIAAMFLVDLLVRRRWKDARNFTLAASGMVVLSGLLDWVTWGKPFNSVIEYMRFTLAGGASGFGVDPPSYYVRALWTSGGLAFAGLALGLALAVRTAPNAVAAIGAFVGSHMVIPHKEFRFISPVMLLAIAVAAVGLVRSLRRVNAPEWSGLALGLAALVGCGIKASRLTNGDLGHYLGRPYATEKVWGFGEEPTLLLAAAGRRPDVCGLATLGLRAGFTGGFSYFHREVPLLYRHRLCDETASANYIISQDGAVVPPEYSAVDRRGSYVLSRRAGACTPPSQYDYMLEGANDMGIYRAPIQQPNKSELRIDAGANASAFISGFSHGERLGCRSVRWATGKSSKVAFDLEPVAQAYRFSLAAQPFTLSQPQSMQIALNGQPLGAYPMSENLAEYDAILTPDRLKRGKNTLDFEFGRAVRASESDTRQLAVLFDRLSLSPLIASGDVDVGTAEGRKSLGVGFGGDERQGARTLAWSQGPISRVTFTLAGGSDAHVLSVVGLAYPPVSPVRVRVTVNERDAGTLTIPTGWSSQGVLLPAGMVQPGLNRVEFAYSATARPSAVERGSTDDRELAVMFDEITLRPVPDATIVDLGTPAAHPHQLTGFSGDEANGTSSSVWSSGPVSSVAFRGFDPKRAYLIRLSVQAFQAALPQRVDVRLNGQSIGHFEPNQLQARYDISVPIGAVSTSSNSVELVYGRTVRPSEAFPGSTDNRELALRFDKIEFAETPASAKPTPSGSASAAPGP